MNNTDSNIQDIKYDLSNMIKQIESINLQNNNPMLYPELNKNPMFLNPIGEQFLDLSKKLFSTGIKAFIAGKRLRLHCDFDFE